MPSAKIFSIEVRVGCSRGNTFILSTQSRMLITRENVVNHNNGPGVKPQRNIAKVSISLIISMKTINEDKVVLFNA